MIWSLQKYAGYYRSSGHHWCSKIDGKIYSLPTKPVPGLLFNKDVFDAANLIPMVTGHGKNMRKWRRGGWRAEKERIRFYGSLNFQPTSMWWRGCRLIQGALSIPLEEEQLEAWLDAAEYCQKAVWWRLSASLRGSCRPVQLLPRTFLTGKYGMMYNGDQVI